MSERFDVFTLGEMVRLSCTCGQCGTEIVFDLSRNPNFGNKCPGCQAALYPMSEIVSSIREAREKAEKAGLNVKLSAPSPG